MWKNIAISDINENIVDLFAKDWALLTAGDKKKFNTMTVSWGTMGFLWNKPVVTVYVRPQRYTYEFMQKKDGFTLSVLPEEYRSSLAICGRDSGRDIDKMDKADLSPKILAPGRVGIEQARLIISCTKLYAAPLVDVGFLERDVIKTHYPSLDYHQFYVGEINEVWEKEEE
ncbi:NADH-FMN oxidoreductase RutF [Parelusimicrobium proximum]|uniref:flavin reductase family protein n=1 Tax=Parelusimicrobium proximum TaxID=3228953 RepID=UPI003D17DF86